MDGVIITVTFCIIGVCALWIWGRMMATLMNQWANEAAIVLVYWNTLRKIEDFYSISALNALLSYYWIATLTHRKERNDNLYFLKHSDWHLSCDSWRHKKLHYVQGRSAGSKKRAKKETKVTLLYPCCSSATHKPVWTEDGSRVKLADRVILQGRHAELLIIPELA